MFAKASDRWKVEAGVYLLKNKICNVMSELRLIRLIFKIEFEL